MTWRYFQRSEFACKHCGQNHIQDRFVHKLDALRDLCRFALVVNSGYRCPAYNQQVSTTGLDGPHTTGRASDVRADRERAFWLLHWVGVMNEEARKAGKPPVFTGIGIKQHGPVRYVHLDDLTQPGHTPRPTIWTYG